MKKGFTLIELLAVIVILAIIALIATPIVLSIINDSKESATIRSAEYYVDALELSVAQSILKGTTIEDGSYEIKDGVLCIDNECTKKLTPEVKGEKPSSGEVTIKEGKIDKITLVISDKTITKGEKGQLVYLNLKYTIGQEVTFNPGDGEKTWNVIDEDATTVTLMLIENLGNTVAWDADSNDNNYGPKDALEYLNSLTTEWDNVDPIKNYIYINNLNGIEKPTGYQKIEIKDGVTTLTHKDGTTTKLDEINKAKARILSLEEVLEIASKTNTNLKEENLRMFIEDNLEEINAELGLEATTVDKTIEIVMNEGLYESKYIQTYHLVQRMINLHRIDDTYDISFQNYLYQNLYTYENTTLPFSYWTLSSSSAFSEWCEDRVPDVTAWSVISTQPHLYGSAVSNLIGYEESNGVRPVITVSKSKL